MRTEEIDLMSTQQTQNLHLRVNLNSSTSRLQMENSQVGTTYYEDENSSSDDRRESKRLNSSLSVEGFSNVSKFACPFYKLHRCCHDRGFPAMNRLKYYDLLNIMHKFRLLIICLGNTCTVVIVVGDVNDVEHYSTRKSTLQTINKVK
jgi:hypothetical protein